MNNYWVYLNAEFTIHENILYIYITKKNPAWLYPSVVIAESSLLAYGGGGLSCCS